MDRRRPVRAPLRRTVLRVRVNIGSRTRSESVREGRSRRLGESLSVTARARMAGTGLR